MGLGVEVPGVLGRIGNYWATYPLVSPSLKDPTNKAKTLASSWQPL